jgi:hypothetical protein
VDPAPATTTSSIQPVGAPALAAAPAGPPLADASPILLARREWSDGGAVERLVEPSGDIVLHALSPAGTVLSCTKVGSLYRLPIESQTDAAQGEVIQLVRDESGALVRYVVQADGEPRAVTVVEPARLAAASTDGR